MATRSEVFYLIPLATETLEISNFKFAFQSSLTTLAPGLKKTVAMDIRLRFFFILCFSKAISLRVYSLALNEWITTHLFRDLEDIAASNLALPCIAHISIWSISSNQNIANLLMSSNTSGSSCRGTVLKGALIKPRSKNSTASTLSWRLPT